MKTICEGCGSNKTVRKISKKDWKKHYLIDNLQVKNSAEIIH